MYKNRYILENISLVLQKDQDIFSQYHKVEGKNAGLFGRVKYPMYFFSHGFFIIKP